MTNWSSVKKATTSWVGVTKEFINRVIQNWVIRFLLEPIETYDSTDIADMFGDSLNEQIPGETQFGTLWSNIFVTSKYLIKNLINKYSWQHDSVLIKDMHGGHVSGNWTAIRRF